MSELTFQRPVILVWVVVTLMLTACAGPWNTAPHQLSGPQWSITPPEGWMHLNTQESEMLSKDGPYLEYILLQSRPLAQRFRHTKQTLNAGMLPHEAARLITDNMRSDPLIRQFHLLASEPEVVTQGFTDSPNEKEILEELRRRIKNTAASANGNLQSDVAKSVRNYLYSETRRNPSVFVTVNKI